MTTVHVSQQRGSLFDFCPEIVLYVLKIFVLKMNLFFQLDAHRYKITEILKLLKFRQLLFVCQVGRIKSALILLMHGTNMKIMENAFRDIKILQTKFSPYDTATLRFKVFVFPCCFLSCKANARAILAKTGHGPHSS
jgi:hypothetical protein